MLVNYIFIPIPMAVVWAILVDQFSIPSLIIGYIIGVGVTALLSRSASVNIYVLKLPGEFLALITYMLWLSRDILLSGVDVALRVIGVRPTRTGIVAVPVQDESEIVAGMSAHSITITPGELVVDFDEEQNIMYVHCLDVEMSVPKVDREQTERLKQFRRILGHD
jgi:multicomponent Na+:H+ antiporter subunit E